MSKYFADIHNVYSEVKLVKPSLYFFILLLFSLQAESLQPHNFDEQQPEEYFRSEIRISVLR